MKRAQKQILTLVLAVASVAILARMVQSFGGPPPAPLEDFVFSQRPKHGFTIWGIQPGDSVPELLQEIPAGTKVVFAEHLHGRSILLDGPVIRTLELTTVGVDKDEIVEKARVKDVQYSTTLELDGNPILRGRELSDEEIRTALPGAKRTPTGFLVTKHGRQLELEYEGHLCLSSMELSLVDTAPHKRK